MNLGSQRMALAVLSLLASARGEEGKAFTRVPSIDSAVVWIVQKSPWEYENAQI